MPRKPLPIERQTISHQFSIEGHTGYITIDLFGDGTPGEMSLVMERRDCVDSELLFEFTRAISYALQYGMPIQEVVNAFKGVRFQPSGSTNNPDIPNATSVLDYAFRWMENRFVNLKATGTTHMDAEDAVNVPPAVSEDN